MRLRPLPTGTHLAVSGRTAEGAAGLFLATNEGTQVQQIVRGEAARFLDGLSFSHDGRRLYFRADHGDYHELHHVRIFSGAETADTERDIAAASLSTVYSGPAAPALSVSPFSRKPRLLYSARCPRGGGDAGVIVGGAETSLDPMLGAIEPVGWLPDGSAVFLAFGDRRCDDFGEGDLYSWSRGEPTLLIRDVDAAAVRARLPAAPDPPSRAQGVVA